MPPSRPASKIEILCWIVFLGVAMGALVWNQHALFFYSWTDEQIHFYVARRVAEGAVLYRDIDSARPPLVILPLAWLIKLGLAPLLAGRALVLGSQLATAGLLFWGGWRLVSWRAGALATLLFLTSPDIFDRVHYTGIQLVTLTTLACVLFFLMAQPLRSGLFLGLTLVAGQHGLPICGIVGLLTFLRSRRDGARFALGALTVAAIVLGGVWAMGGRHLWESLVGHHLYHLSSREGDTSQFWERFTPWIYEHVYLFVGAALAMALLGTKRSEGSNGGLASTPGQIVRRLLLLVGAHLAVVLVMADAVFLYIVLITPFLTLLAGIGFDATVGWWKEGRRSSRARSRRAFRLITAGGAATIALTAAGWAAAQSHREGLDERQYSFWPHVRHGQLARFQRLDVARQILEDVAFPKIGTLFGDPTIASAVALQSGLRIAGEFADLDSRWLDAGTVSREDVVSHIEHDGVAAIITSPWFIAQSPYFRSYVMACYETPRIFAPPDSGPGSGLFDILVYPHKRGESDCRIAKY
jgi:hypothetical protein